MPAVVKLQEVLEAMDFPDSWGAYLNPETGRILILPEEECDAFENGDLDLLENLDPEELAELEEGLEPGRWLSLPDSFDVHEWAIMKRFSLDVDDPAARDQLLDAIHGRGAFRMFRRTVERLDLLEAWYAYRDAAVEQVARDWLEAEGLAYE